MTLKKNHQNKPKVKSLPFSIKVFRLLLKSFGPLFPHSAAQFALRKFMTPKRKRQRKAPKIFDHAFMIGTPYDNGKIRAYMWGFTGKIVLLVHGWESESYAFEKFIPALVSSGFRVVAVEGPAHGDSKQKQTSMIDFGDALQGLIERLEKSGGVSAVVGHSFGGSTLINLFYRFSPPKSLEKIILIAIPERIDLIFNRYFNFLQLPEKVVAQFEADMETLFGLQIEELRVKNWISIVEDRQVLILHDRHDKVIPFQEAKALALHWPKATIWETENLGHNRILKDAATIDKTVLFLKT